MPDEIKPLLVCSVFAGVPEDADWLRLQRSFLKENTGPHDYAIFLGHRGQPENYPGCQVIGKSERGHESEHMFGLNAIADYARAHRYGAYLILDSDAFPISPQWQERLDLMLSRFKKDYVCALRIENLDSFPHPAVVYTRDPQFLQFGFIETTNLVDVAIRDIACTAANPVGLVRSNPRCAHPSLATVYHDLFYHHGCGSRDFRMRAVEIGYYEGMMERYPSSDELLDTLWARPREFIDSLMQPAEISRKDSAGDRGSWWKRMWLGRKS